MKSLINPIVQLIDHKKKANMQIIYDEDDREYELWVSIPKDYNVTTWIPSGSYPTFSKAMNALSNAILVNYEEGLYD